MINVVCMKTGSKYGPEYVNKLQAMVARNLKKKFKFYCITDNSEGISPTVNIIITTPQHKGWWNKLTLFSSMYGLDGTILYMDLDIVIVGPLEPLRAWGEDQLFNKGRQLVIMQDWWQKTLNSSVMMFNTGTLSFIYKSFIEKQTTILNSLHGDQNWITGCMKDKSVITWPQEWILSYKTHILGTSRDRVRHEIEEYPDVKIMMFHGEPRPHQIDEKFVEEHWRN